MKIAREFASQAQLLCSRLDCTAMPPKVNDEATRLQKRCGAVEAIKSKHEYASLDETERPQTPDPTEAMSKRCWEKSVMTWRKELHALKSESSA